MRRNCNRNQQDDEANTLEIVLSKYRALKRAFRKLSEDYDYNFALFKERDEELDLLEEQLKIEKMKTTRYRERVRELERELALSETTASWLTRWDLDLKSSYCNYTSNTTNTNNAL